MKRIVQSILSACAFSLISTAAVFAQTPQGQAVPSGAPQIKSVTPSDGQTIYGSKIPVLVTVENFQLVDFQNSFAPTPSQGHVHLWLDDQNPTTESAQKSIDGQSIYNDVSYGDHTLMVELVNNDHTPLIPPVKTSVTFKTAPVGTPTPVQSSGFDKKTAFVILVIVALVILAAWWYTKEEDEEPQDESKPTKEIKSQKRKTTKKAPKKRK